MKFHVVIEPSVWFQNMKKFGKIIHTRGQGKTTEVKVVYLFGLKFFALFLKFVYIFLLD
jgi:hypothetical protein